MDYTAARTELKNDICSYFVGAGITREMLPKILKAIKADAAEGCPFDLLKNFAPSHHEIVKSFVVRLRKIESDWEEVEVEDEDAAFARLEQAQKDLDDALPMGFSGSAAKIRSAEIDIAEGRCTVEEAVDRLTSKKIITRR